MCYYVGTKKVREVILKRKQSGNWDDLDQLFYDTFISRNDKAFIENYLALGFAQPELTTLSRQNGSLAFGNMQWTLPYNKVDRAGNHLKTYELQIVSCEKVMFIFKDMIYAQRCILPMDGYFEYHHLGKNKYPYYIYPSAEEEIFYAAGVWGVGIDKKTGQQVNKFALITTPPNPMVGKIHNNPDAENGPRMLLLLPRKKALEFLDNSLDAGSIKSFFKPFPEDMMKAHTVMKFQTKENAQYLNTARNLEYWQYPELNNLSLNLF